MPTEDVAYQQRLRIRRTTLGFGVIQVILGLALTALSFTAFVLSESEKIRNACPYWAGFTVLCSGGVGIFAWRHSTVLSMGLFTFFSAVCVVLHMIGTILTGEVGGLLKSIILCQQNIINQSCMCCDSIMTCKQNIPSYKFEGVEDCSILTGLLKELLYSLCVLNIFGSLVCFIATILGCTSVARQAGRDQPLFRRRLSAPSDSHEQSQYSWLHYSTDLNMLPSYAPPIYRSVDNFQDCGATPYIVPPPVYDPTDLPPPYSSGNVSLSSSGFSLYVQGEGRNGLGRGRECNSSIVVQEVVSSNSENQFQQRIYSENRGRPGNAVRPGNPVRITSAILTRNGVLEFRSNRSSNHGDRTADQSLNSSRASLQSEARRPLNIIGQQIEGIAQRLETRVFQRYEKAEECKEVDESVKKLDPIQDQTLTSQNYKWKYRSKKNINGIQRHLSNVEQSTEIIRFEDRDDDNERNPVSNEANNVNSNLISKGTCKMDNDVVGERQVNSSLSAFEEEPSSNSNSDSGLGDDMSPLCQFVNLSSDNTDSNSLNIMDTDKCQGDYISCNERSRFDASDTNLDIDVHCEEGNCNTTMQDVNTLTAISEDMLVGDHDKGNFEQSFLRGAACSIESGTSNAMFESSLDDEFEGAPSSVFGISNGLEPLRQFFHQVPLARLSETPSSTGQESEEFIPYRDCKKSENQELNLSEERRHGQFITGDTSCLRSIPKEANHQHMMPNHASHQLMPSDASHQIIPSDASHHQSVLNAKQQYMLIASNKDHQMLPSDVNHHRLTPSDASHQRLLSNDAKRQYKLLQLDMTHHPSMSSDVEHCQSISDDAASQLRFQFDHNIMNQDASSTGLLLSIDDASDLHSSCHGIPFLVSKVSRRHGPENAAGMSCMGYRLLESEVSAECCKDKYCEPDIKLQSLREKDKNDSELTAKESVRIDWNHNGKTDEEIVLNRNNMLSCPGKQEKSNYERKKEDKHFSSMSRNRSSDDTEEVIHFTDDFKSSNDINRIGLPVAEVDANLEAWEQLSQYLEQQPASSIHDTLPKEDSHQLESSMSSGRSSVDCDCNHAPNEIPCDSLETNFAETLSDSGSEHVPQISLDNKPLARSDTCIVMETNYLKPREKIRTCSDPEVKGLGITGGEFQTHRKRNRGRLFYDNCMGMAPPNIELPVEIRHQGLGYCPDESKVQNKNTGNGEQRLKQKTEGNVNNLVKNKPKTQRCRHRNKESSRRNKDDLLKKEKALMKSIKLRNEMSRSFVHLYRAKKLTQSGKDSKSFCSPGSEVKQNASKKRKVVQRVQGELGNSGLVSSVEYLKKDSGTGQDSEGKETFV